MKYLPGFLIRFLLYFFGVFLSIPSSIPLKASFRFPLTFFLSFEQFFQGLLFKNRPGFLNPERFLLEQFMGIQQIFFPEYLPELSQCCCQSLSWTKDSHRVFLSYCCWIELKDSLGVPVEWFSGLPPGVPLGISPKVNKFSPIVSIIVISEISGRASPSIASALFHEFSAEFPHGFILCIAPRVPGAISSEVHTGISSRNFNVLSSRFSFKISTQPLIAYQSHLC